MLRIVIVDDEKVVADILESFFKRYSEEHAVDYSIEWYSNPIVFLTEYTNRFDIVFLDIELPSMNGVECARKLREVDTSVSLVFVTNMKQYAINGYEVNADDFIVKPVSYYDFAMKLERLFKKMNIKKEVKISVRNDGMIKCLDIVNIRYVDVFKHKLTYHTTEGDFECRGSINKIEELFLANHFAKCNKYCFANLRYVTGVDGYKVLLSYGRNSEKFDELAISRPRKKEFVTSLSKYLGVNV